MCRWGGALLVVLCSLCSNGARADGRGLEYDHAATWSSVGAAAAGYGTVELAWPAPQSCGLCATNAVDLWIAHSIGAWRHPERYALVSDLTLWTGVGGAAASSFAAGGAAQGLQDVAIISQVTLFTGLFTAILKRLSARQRPGIYLDNPYVEIGSGEANLSFFSGHSSFSASLAASLVTLAYLRGYGYRHWALGVGLAYTLTVGTLRIAAQRHWFSDVLVGWLVGASLGVALPLMLHGRKAQGSEAQARAIPLLQGSF